MDPLEDIYNGLTPPNPGDSAEMRAARDGRVRRGEILPNPNDQFEVDTYRLGEIKRESELQAPYRKGWVLPQTPQQREWSQDRIRKLQSTQKPDGNRPLDIQWVLAEGRCRICGIGNVPLFQCDICRDYIYCGPAHQIQGCGNKHL
jgi:hypothetical protein